jgi:hypothetical protein
MPIANLSFPAGSDMDGSNWTEITLRRAQDVKTYRPINIPLYIGFSLFMVTAPEVQALFYQAAYSNQPRNMPRALAKIGDHVVAETETWETVEGNIYVYRPCLLSTVVGFCLGPRSRCTVPTVGDQRSEPPPALGFVHLLLMEGLCFVLERGCRW